MSYLYGKLVTQSEKMFFEKVLTDLSRQERGKQFNSIVHTAKRNNISLQNAFTVVNNNKKLAEDLTNRSKNNQRFALNKFGEVCEIKKSFNGVEFYKKVSDASTTGKKEVKELPQSKFTKHLSSILKTVKKTYNYVKELLTVY